MISLLALLAGFLLDLLIGDPHFLYHPVRLVGALISFLFFSLSTGQKDF